ncbi:hypothetical protein EII12_01965 [Buchananella hordeovulneris]|nr:hypothetical protein EII12_01965 [Buchananella hordeovulneris]
MLPPPRFDEDCTWFISQALWQGGIPKSDEWNDHSSDPKKTHRKHNPGPTAPARLAGELFWYLMRTNQVSLKKIDWNDNTASGANWGI